MTLKFETVTLKFETFLRSLPFSLTRFCPVMSWIVKWRNKGKDKKQEKLEFISPKNCNKIIITLNNLGLN